jgi:voltage-gated potassium channel
MGTVKDPFRRVWIGLGALLFVLVLGTSGYLILGFGLLDGIYQTVSTVTTVGFNAPHRLGTTGKAFTIVLILVGVGTALYTFSSVFEVFIDGHMRDLMRRRRMERGIDRMDKHVIVCGWGRVGQEVARFLTNAGRDIVVIDRNPDRLVDFPFAFVCGDVTDDETLIQAGIDQAATLVAAARHRCRQSLRDGSEQVNATGPSGHCPGPQRIVRTEIGARRSGPSGKSSTARRRSNGIFCDSSPRS